MLALFTMGGPEWIIILIVALLLFGRRLPEVMRSMGQGVHQFKRGLRDVEDEVESAGEDKPDPHSNSSSSVG
jgi:sec-independent protein translocase protein TatA